MGRLKGAEQRQFHSGWEHWLPSCTDLGLPLAPVLISYVSLYICFHFFELPFPFLYHEDSNTQPAGLS